ncbi:hypothetical protein F5I97DRAFT_1894123 [Phlebopus sp. FC_14]|nr:hypothetical protein F5I97DRAFT_1894123 [Phlebopus sp. FC_14]
MVPRVLQWPPEVPDVDGCWWCPVEGCGYLIDLRNLREENGPGVAENVILYVMQKSWQNGCQDQTVFGGFVKMVERHYLKHFAEEGLEFVVTEASRSNWSGSMATRLVICV